jgi:hypothetical protein
MDFVTGFRLSAELREAVAAASGTTYGNKWLVANDSFLTWRFLLAKLPICALFCTLHRTQLQLPKTATALFRSRR